MLHLFRTIRQSLINEGKTSKYFRYAFGEIVLIVVGILLALQISEWNQQRKDRAREKILLTELVSNLQTNIANLESDIEIQVKSAGSLWFLLDHLDNQRPYDEPLNHKFSDANFAPDVVLTSSAFETLKSSGLELIKSDSLRREIINMFEVDYPFLLQETRRLEDQVWPAVVVPMYQKHFRSEIRGSLRPVDYQALLQDKEFTNMLSFRLALRESSTEQKQNVAKKTQAVIQLIEAELAN
jgi:hypothetical protein